MKQLPAKLYFWILFALGCAALGILAYFEIITLTTR